MAKPFPASFITCDIVNQRTRRYKDERHKQLSSILSEQYGRKVEDTKSVWYSKKQIQDWLEELTDLEGSGLRIYFGQIEEPTPADEENRSPLEPLPGQLCLIIVPTKQGSNENSHINIQYEQLPDYELRRQLTEGLPVNRAFNFGSYNPPKTITEGDDYPND